MVRPLHASKEDLVGMIMVVTMATEKGVVTLNRGSVDRRANQHPGNEAEMTVVTVKITPEMEQHPLLGLPLEVATITVDTGNKVEDTVAHLVEELLLGNVNKTSRRRRRQAASMGMDMATILVVGMVILAVDMANRAWEHHLALELHQAWGRHISPMEQVAYHRRLLLETK